MSMKPIRLPLPEDQAPEIVPAGEADVPAVMDLLRRRIAWMDEKNLYQWNKTGYLNYYPAGHFLQLVRENLLYAAKDRGGLVGVMALLERDPRWPNGDDGRASTSTTWPRPPAIPAWAGRCWPGRRTLRGHGGRPSSAWTPRG